MQQTFCTISLVTRQIISGHGNLFKLQDSTRSIYKAVNEAVWMDKSLFFIAGSHGAGKTTLCKLLSKKTGFISISASDLLKKMTGRQYIEKKVASEIIDNQRILVRAINEMLNYHNKIIIEGHFCLVNSNGQLERLPDFIFKELPIKKIILLDIDADIIHERLIVRDGKNYSVDFIQNIVDEEKKMAEQVAINIGCTLHICKNMLFESYIDELSALLYGTQDN